MFIDYLTKWPEVFATSDQTSLTIAELLVEHVISRHGVPSELGVLPSCQNLCGCLQVDGDSEE